MATERKIALGSFVQYIVKKYRWTSSFVGGCLGKADDTNYLSFTASVGDAKFVSKKDRLYHDLEYLVLILQDYCEQNRRKRTAVSRRLEELLSLYGPNQVSLKSTKGKPNA